MLKNKTWPSLTVLPMILLGIITSRLGLDFTSIQMVAHFLPKVWSFYSYPVEKGDTSNRDWQTMNYLAMNHYFDSLETDFPKDIVKAIAWCESEWQHWDQTGRPLIGVNRKYMLQSKSGQNPVRKQIITLDWGLMQINEESHSLNPKQWNLERIKADPLYNLRAGVAILESKRAYINYLKTKPNWQQIKHRYRLDNCNEMEMVLKAYNGFQLSGVYVRKVKRVCQQKPWEKAMRQQLAVNQSPQWNMILYFDDSIPIHSQRTNGTLLPWLEPLLFLNQLRPETPATLDTYCNLPSF